MLSTNCSQQNTEMLAKTALIHQTTQRKKIYNIQFFKLPNGYKIVKSMPLKYIR